MNNTNSLSAFERATSPINVLAHEISPESALERLCRALDTAFDLNVDALDPSHRASFAKAVRAALAEAAADPALLTDAQRQGADNCYRRHLLAADPDGRYAIAALVWMPGQASPIHAHHTWCGYAVIDGTLTETVYDLDAATDCAVPVREQPREAGAVSFTRAGRAGIHRLGNDSDAPAISLHIYGVAGEQISTHVNDILRAASHAQAALA